MPSLKTWHFEALGGVKVLRNGKPLVNKRGSELGYVKALRVPNKVSTCAAAEKFIVNAIQVTFNGNVDVVLNREDFQWNKNEFCRHFKSSIDACQFIVTWNKFTRYDSDGGKFIYFSNGDCATPSNSDSAASNSQQTETDDTETCTASPACTGRKRNNEGKIVHNNLMDDSILKKRVGLFKLPVLALQEAKAEHLVRSIDTIFLSHLKKRIKEDPAGPGVAPLAVVCISVDSISSFSEKWLSVYKYEVLGGQHTALAKKDLLKENPANSFFKDVWAEVYVGLTSDEALRLGSRHNKNGHFIHKMTHRDYVETCRSKLFTMNGVKPGTGIDPSPSIEWKQVCNRCILPETLSQILD